MNETINKAYERIDLGFKYLVLLRKAVEQQREVEEKVGVPLAGTNRAIREYIKSLKDLTFVFSMYGIPLNPISK